MEKSSLGLPEACRWLREKAGVGVTFRRLYSAVLDGTIPAMKDESGSRWVIKADDLDTIASHFLASENTFPRIQLIPDNFADGLELGIPARFIADSVRIGGLKRVLPPLDPDQRKAVGKAYKKAGSVLPNLDDEWGRWRETLVGYGLGKHLGAIPVMAFSGDFAANCKDSVGEVNCNLAA